MKEKKQIIRNDKNLINVIYVDPIKNCPWQNNLFGQILVSKDWSWWQNKWNTKMWWIGSEELIASDLKMVILLDNCQIEIWEDLIHELTKIENVRQQLHPGEQFKEGKNEIIFMT